MFGFLKGHIVRAALEAAAYQAREVFDAIYADSKVLLKELKVDGGGSHNQLLMQFQADMIRAPVVIPCVQETTAMGAAFAAGLAVGVWKDLGEVKALWKEAKVFVPKMPEEERAKNWLGWKKAVSRSLEWVEVDDDNDYFLDAETFSHDEDDDRLLAAKNTGDSAGVSLGTILTLVAVAGIGASVGFLLGHRRHA
jgi:FGGY family of carbohydrate kinases, C-terminal domain